MQENGRGMTPAKPQLVASRPPALLPQNIFTADEWAQLRRHSPVTGPLLVAHAWGLTFAAMALFVAVPHPVIQVTAIMVIGTRQLGLAVLMHDAAHRALHPDAQLNDFLGQWLCAAPLGARLAEYRPCHLAHHRFVQQAEDPDLGLSAPFPITRASLWRKILRDLSGLTFLRQRSGVFLAAVRRAKTDPAQKRNVVADNAGSALPGFFLANLVLVGVLALAGHAELFIYLWLPALATWFPLVTRLRNIGEHACVPDNDDPLRNARTVLAGPLERLFIAPYWVHFHVEHHLFMYLPCYRLEAAHKMLIAKGFGPRMEIRRSYREMLAMAAPKSGAR